MAWFAFFFILWGLFQKVGNIRFTLWLVVKLIQYHREVLTLCRHVHWAVRYLSFLNWKWYYRLVKKVRVKRSRRHHYYFRWHVFFVRCCRSVWGLNLFGQVDYWSMVHWLLHFFNRRGIDVSRKLQYPHLFIIFLLLLEELFPDLIVSLTLLMSLTYLLDLVLSLLQFWVKQPVKHFLNHCFRNT